MSTADKRFNGTIVSFASGNMGLLISTKRSSRAKAIDCSGANAAQALSEPGKTNNSLTLTIRGTGTAKVGDKGNLTVTWNDGGNTALGNCAIFELNENGQEDNAIETDYTFQPCALTT